MKLKKGVSLTDFIRQVKKCRYDVYFETTEGDHLNLKSTLSEFMFTSSAGDEAFIESGDITCDSGDDYAVVGDYLEER